MRILHLIKHCRRANGHVHVAVDLACLHACDGHSVHFASGGGTYGALLQSHGVECHTLAHQLGWRTPASLANLIRLCRAIRPDVIHAHMMSSAVLGFVASRLCGIPLVTTVHNSFDRHSSLMRLGDVVVAVSEAERHLLLSRGYSEHKVVAIRNGTAGSPREALAPAAPPMLTTPCVMSVAGLHPRKGVDQIVTAFAAVAREFPAWQLQIVGEGPDAVPLRSLTVDLGVGERVHFIGAVPMAKPWLERAQIFVLASFAEPCGLVLTEARAAGCAIIATAVGGTPEILEHGAAGHLVRPAHPEEIAAAFRALMGDPDHLQHWRDRSRRGAEAFTAGRMADRYLDIYQGLRNTASNEQAIAA